MFNEIIGKKQIHNLRGQQCNREASWDQILFWYLSTRPSHNYLGTTTATKAMHFWMCLYLFTPWSPCCDMKFDFVNAPTASKWPTFMYGRIYLSGEEDKFFKKVLTAMDTYQKRIQLLLLYPPLRPECWEYVLCLFWWWDHCPSAKRMWNPETYQAWREDFHKLCKFWTQQLQLRSFLLISSKVVIAKGPVCHRDVGAWWASCSIPEV